VPELPTVKAETVISALKRAGFEIMRQRGSHVRLRHSDGRVVTVPVHSGQERKRDRARFIKLHHSQYTGV